MGLSVTRCGHNEQRGQSWSDSLRSAIPVLTGAAQSSDNVYVALPVEIPRRRLSRQQRDQVLEHLLGQDIVLQLLYG